MEALLQLGPVTHNHHLKSLRGVYDKVESHVQALKALGITTESYGTVLTSVLMSRLPPELKLIISCLVMENDWELDSLMKQIEKEVEARERAATTSNTDHRRHVLPVVSMHMTGSNRKENVVTVSNSTGLVVVRLLLMLRPKSESCTKKEDAIIVCKETT